MIWDFGLGKKQVMRHFEFNPLIFTPTILNLKSKMGRDCELGEEKQGQRIIREREKDMNNERDKDKERGRVGGSDRNFALSLSHTSVSSGFTLVELLVVMVIIGMLAALVAPRFIRQEEKAKVKTAQAQIELLGTALDTFRLDTGRYPNTQEGLEALRGRPGGLKRWDGPYIKKSVPSDPWGRSYSYRSPGQNGPYDLVSYGADGAPGGEGDNRDLTSWQE